MEIASKGIEVDRGAVVSEMEFGISQKDIHILFDTLRSRLYPNPIKAVCREILTNARDAHIEVGKESTPIEIHLPNVLEPYFGVQDFGPGIDPERMSTVFTQFCASTKRDSNLQAGGFGLGAKSPFAYSDSFIVETVTPEKDYTENGIHYSNCLVKRSYTLYVDETEKGKCVCTFAQVTTEPQGTLIKVSVKDEDFDSFSRYAEFNSRFWDIKPIVVGDPNFQYEEKEYRYKGNNWQAVDDRNGELFAILAGIPYRLDWNSIKKGKDTEYDGFRALYSFSGYIAFNTGELDVTPGREELQYSKKTIDNITNALRDILGSIHAQNEAIITAADSYQNACVEYNEIQGTLFKFPKDRVLLWKNKIPIVSTLEIEEADQPFVSFRGFYRARGQKRVSFVRLWGVKFSPKLKFYTTGVKAERSRIKTLFETVEPTQIIWADETDDAKKKELTEKYHLNELVIEDLSKVEFERRVYASGVSKQYSYIRKLNDNSKYNHMMGNTDKEALEEGDLYLLLEKRRLLFGSRRLESYDVPYIVFDEVVTKLLDKKPIYIIPMAKATLALKGQNLYDFLMNKFNSMPDTIYDEYTIYNDMKHTDLYEIMQLVKKGIKDKTSFAYTYFEELETLDSEIKNSTKDKSKTVLANLLGVSYVAPKGKRIVKDFTNHNQKLEQLYPLVANKTLYPINRHARAVLQYINLMNDFYTKK